MQGHVERCAYVSGFIGICTIREDYAGMHRQM